ncbi:hypothetical protein Leryth_024859 [Lithospermum erythrorhizon]|nr:hypothetical protein Leryth_024859 [Lithospermum erythrorhizon]
MQTHHHPFSCPFTAIWCTIRPAGHCEAYLSLESTIKWDQEHARQRVFKVRPSSRFVLGS